MGHNGQKTIRATAEADETKDLIQKEACGNLSASRREGRNFLPRGPSKVTSSLYVAGQSQD